MTDVLSYEFLDVVTLWLRRTGEPYARRVLSVVQDNEISGGCYTCWETCAVLRITFIDADEETHAVTRRTVFADLVKQLEQLAQHEARRRPRLDMLRTMKSAIREMPGRSDMVYRVLKGMDYPGPDGQECRAEVGDIVTYLPPGSIEHLVRDGRVKPLCTSGMSGEDCACDWCRLAALTRDDKEWLSLYGWKNPFEREAAQR